MLLLINITIHVSFNVAQNLTTYKEEKQEIYKDYIGLVQTMRKQEKRTLLTNKKQRDLKQKYNYKLWTDEI